MAMGGRDAAGALGGWRADPLRLGLAVLLVLLIALVCAAIAMFATPPPRETRTVSAPEPPAAPSAAPSVAPAQAPAARTEEPAAIAPPVREAGAVGRSVVGTARVVDTATLRIGDRIVALKGVLGASGEQAHDMAGWLAGREVRCERIAAERHSCAVDGWDLAEVVLFNGGGRAAPDASPGQRKAERQAREARRGLWAAR